MHSELKHGADGSSLEFHSFDYSAASFSFCRSVIALHCSLCLFMMFCYYAIWFNIIHIYIHNKGVLFHFILWICLMILTVFTYELPTLYRVALSHMEHTARDCPFQTRSHLLEILCLVLVRCSAWRTRISTLHVFRCICNANKRVENNIEARQKEYKAAKLCALSSTSSTLPLAFCEFWDQATWLGHICSHIQLFLMSRKFHGSSACVKEASATLWGLMLL